MTTKQILNMGISDFNRMDRRELSKAVSTLASTANKRIASLRKSGVASSAYNKAMSGGRFGAKGKNVQQLRGEFVRVRSFLTAETSTVKGAKGVMANTIRSLRDRGVQIDADNYNKFFDAYERLKRIDPSVSNKALRYKVFDEIANTIDGVDTDTVVQTIMDKLSEIYESGVDNDNGLSAYFEM